MHTEHLSLNDYWAVYVSYEILIPRVVAFHLSMLYHRPLYGVINLPELISPLSQPASQPHSQIVNLLIKTSPHFRQVYL